MTATPPTLDLLLPSAADAPTERIAPDPGEARLSRLYAYPAPVRGSHVVRANMVSSLDGGAWGEDHVSGDVNDDADWRVFRVLRALADVVLVGAGTARAEGYTQLDSPAGLARPGPPLELALVTRTGSVPPVLAAGDRPPLVLTGSTGQETAKAGVPADRVIVVGQARAPDWDETPEAGDRAATSTRTAPPGALDLAAGLDALAARGLGRILCEGGPTLLGALLHADLVDEVCVTTTPLIVGPGPGRIVAGPTPVGASAWPSRGARLAHLLHAHGTTLARWTLPLG